MDAGMSVVGMFLLVLTNGSSLELLDWVDTETYWRQQGVEMTADALAGELGIEDPPQKEKQIRKLARKLGAADFEVRERATNELTAIGRPALPVLKQVAEADDVEAAERAKAIIAAVSRPADDPKAIIAAVSRPADETGFRRLMAIRALGETQAVAARDELKTLTNSEDLFVAEYAQRALATINGKKPPARGTVKPKVLREDVLRLPKESGLVLQHTELSAQPTNLEDAFSDAGPMVAMMGGVGRLMEQLTEQTSGIGSKVGNFRVSAITVAVSSVIGDEEGFIVAIARGTYDHRAVSAALRGMPNMTANELAGHEVFMPRHEGLVVAPVDDASLVFAAAPSQAESRTCAAALLKAGEDETLRVTANERLAPLLETVDRSGPIWAVCAVDDSYRQAPILRHLKHLTLSTRALNADRMAVRVDATGIDEEQTEMAVETLKTKLGELLATFPVQQMPDRIKALIEAFRKLELDAKGTKASLDVTLPRTSPMLLIQPWIGISGAMHAAPPPNAVPPAEAVREARPK